MEMKNSYKVLVTGTVQGVGYRFFAKLMADRLKITGCVKNLKNGDVELQICTSEEAKERYIKQLWRGPQFSRVTKVDVESIEYKDFESFEVMFK